jgi:hypothetical protein
MSALNELEKQRQDFIDQLPALKQAIEQIRNIPSSGLIDSLEALNAVGFVVEKDVSLFEEAELEDSELISSLYEKPLEEK